MIVNADVDVNA